MDRNSLKVLFEESKKYAEKMLTALRKNPNSIVIIDGKIYHNPMIRISFKGVFLEDVESLEVLPLFYNDLDDVYHSIFVSNQDEVDPTSPLLGQIHNFFQSRLKLYTEIKLF